MNHPWQWVVLYALVLLAGTLFHDLWAPDEPRFGQVTREMIETSNYVVPHLNGEIYTDKPPLYFWLSSLAAKIFGLNEFSVRLPSVLAGLGSLVLCFFLARQMFGLMPAFFAVAVLGTTYRFWWQAVWCQLDMLLTFFICGALSLFWFAYFKKKSRGWWVLFYLCLAGGFLTKGPIGFLFPCGIIFFFLLWERRFSFISQMHVFLGSLVFFGLIGLWVGLAYQNGGGEYLYQHFIYHNFTRYTDPWGHIRPFYYYFINFPVDCLPWTFFLPFALLFAWRSKSQHQSVYRFLFIWFTLIFVFFTLSESKRNLYLLPLFPAVALLLGQYFFEKKETCAKAFKITVSLSFAILILVLLVGYPLMDRYKSARPLCEVIKKELSAKSMLASYQFLKEDFIYYTGQQIRVLSKEEDFSAFIQDKDHLVLLKQPDYEFLKQKYSLVVLKDEAIGHRHFYVVRGENAK